jgi:amino acid adenylation domain-containing protein
LNASAHLVSRVCVYINVASLVEGGRMERPAAARLSSAVCERLHRLTADHDQWMAAGALMLLRRYGATEPVVIGCDKGERRLRPDAAVTFHSALAEVRQATLGERATTMEVEVVCEGDELVASPLGDAPGASGIAGHLATLLSAAAEHPDGRVDELPLLTASERADLERQNDTSRPLPTGSLAELFHEVVQRTPDASALVFDGTTWSYSELARRAGAIALRLRTAGMPSHALVAVLAERGPAAVAAQLGIVLAGATYVPIDPQNPGDRITRILADCRPWALLHDDAMAVRAKGQWLLTFAIDFEAGNELFVDNDPAELAYVMYTSGSTGDPKGVEVFQRSVVRLVRNTNYIEISSGDRIAQAASCAFDASTFEIWGALLNGATLVILASDTLLEPTVLASELRRQRITTLFLTTALFNHTVRAAPDAFAPLRTVIFGGEAVNPRWVRAVLSHGAPKRLLHAYGPTETTTFTAFHEVLEVEEDARTIPIGLALANDRLDVLDPGGQPVPVGVEGELYIGGAGVARGYLGRAELTAQRFIRDPLTGERRYRTGDRVRRRSDGPIEFLGRFDEQVKIRGYRIEPGEIVAALRRHPAVRDAAVVAHGAAAGERVLYAHVVVQRRGPTLARALRGFLEQLLPPYMVPTRFEWLDALPLTANGKLDRARLLPANQTGAPTDEVFDSQTERALSKMFGEILDRPPAGARDGFFELGGDSLMVAQLLARLEHDLGKRLLPCQVMSHSSVQALARLIDDLPSTSVGIVRRARPDEWPVAPAQQRPWSPLGAVLRRYLLQGPFDRVAFERALMVILERHAPLRTRFRGGGAEIMPAPARLLFHDVSSYASEERERRARALAAELLETPFDLASGPPARFMLLQLGDERHAFVLAAHHSVFDGVSLANFWNELDAAYGATLLGRTPSLPPLQIDYGDYAAWQREICEGPVGDAQREWWQRALEGAVAPRVPTDHPRADVEALRREHPMTAFPVAVSGWALEPAWVAPLAGLARACDATLHIVLLAAYTRLLGSWSGDFDLTISAAQAGREQQGTAPLIGFFTQSAMLRVRLEESASFASDVASVREVLAAASAHLDIPDNHVDTQRFRVGFNYHPVIRPRLGGVEITSWPGPTGGGKTRWFDLEFALWEDSSTLRGALRYNQALFSQPTIDARLKQLDQILRGAIVDPDGRTCP